MILNEIILKMVMALEDPYLACMICDLISNMMRLEIIQNIDILLDSSEKFKNQLFLYLGGIQINEQVITNCEPQLKITRTRDAKEAADPDLLKKRNEVRSLIRLIGMNTVFTRNKTFVKIKQEISELSSRIKDFLGNDEILASKNTFIYEFKEGVLEMFEQIK